MELTPGRREAAQNQDGKNATAYLDPNEDQDGEPHVLVQKGSGLESRERDAARGRRDAYCASPTTFSHGSLHTNEHNLTAREFLTEKQAAESSTGKAGELRAF